MKKQENKTDVYEQFQWKETNSYKGWLNSDHFWKRVLAIQGYSLVPLAFTIIVIIIFTMIVYLITLAHTIFTA